MRIARKRVLWSMSVLALVLIIAVFAAHTLTDRTHLEELARTKVQQAWSRQLTIGGLALRLFPYPHLRATDVTISNPAWARDKHLLEPAIADLERVIATDPDHPYALGELLHLRMYGADWREFPQTMVRIEAGLREGRAGRGKLGGSKR